MRRMDDLMDKRGKLFTLVCVAIGVGAALLVSSRVEGPGGFLAGAGCLAVAIAVGIRVPMHFGWDEE